MAEFPAKRYSWYPRYPADFIDGTLGLSLEEKGAYAIVLDLIYDRRGAVADDPRYLAGVCGCSIRKWRQVRARLIETGKLVTRGDRLSNERAEFELEISSKTTRKLAESGSKGGHKRAENERELRKNNDLAEATLKLARGRGEEKREEESSSSLRSEKDSSDLFGESAGEEPASSEEASAAGQGRRPYPPWFEAIWTAYPATKRKTAKVAVFREVQKAIKRDGYLPDRLLVAVEAYARHAAAEGWLDGGDDFTKAPETFFRQGAYEAFLDGAGPGQAAGSKPPRRGARIDTTG